MKNNRVIIVSKENEFGLEFVGKFYTITDASKNLGVHKSQICRCLNGVKHYKTAHGYRFIYQNED